MTDITGILGDSWQKDRANIDPPELQLADAMRSAGIEPPPKIQIDGQLHRFSTKGRKKDDSGWYVVYSEGVPAGSFGCWRDLISVNFRADIGRELTASEQMAITKRTSEARAVRDAERQKKNEVAASTVDKIWTDAGAASPEHPYLQRKGINSHGARITGDGRLIVPMFNADGALSSLQYITSEGDKKYHPGGAVKVCHWMLGDPDRTIFIAEGFATAATILEVSGQAVAVAYSAGNIPAVAQEMRDKFGTSQEIVIVADNDKSGVGKNYAEQAAAKMGARIVMPPTDGDANDYNADGGNLLELLYPPVTDWLIHADDFSSQPAPISWQIKHWVQDKALMMVHGPSGGGKTFMVLDWMLSIASGKPDWFGHKVRGGRVVYLAGEGHHGLKGRVAAWKQHNGVKTLDMYLSKAGCDLNTPEGYQKVAESIRALDATPRTIVVDTLHRFLNGDENSAQDAKTMLDACAALMAEFNCTVILVHHTGVSDESQHRARGSSAWKGALDIEVSVVPPKNDGAIAIVQRKSKDSEMAETIHADLETVAINGWKDEDGDPVTSAVLIKGSEPAKAKSDGPLQKNMKTFERAWFDSGAEDRNGVPYLSRSALERFLEKDGHKPRTIENMMNVSYDDRLIGRLINAEIIVTDASGWAVNDLSFASNLMIMRGK